MEAVPHRCIFDDMSVVRRTDEVDAGKTWLPLLSSYCRQDSNAPHRRYSHQGRTHRFDFLFHRAVLADMTWRWLWCWWDVSSAYLIIGGPSYTSENRDALFSKSNVPLESRGFLLPRLVALEDLQTVGSVSGFPFLVLMHLTFFLLVLRWRYEEGAAWCPLRDRVTGLMMYSWWGINTCLTRSQVSRWPFWFVVEWFRESTWCVRNLGRMGRTTETIIYSFSNPVPRFTRLTKWTCVGCQKDGIGQAMAGCRCSTNTYF